MTWASPRRWSVRMRLTTLVGGLLLGSGILLVGITYVLVDLATANETVTIVLPDGSSVAFSSDSAQATVPPDDHASGTDDSPLGAMPSPGRLAELAAEQHSQRMLTLLSRSGIALAVTAALGILLGWVVSGRILRPVRTIAERTQRITATDLHQRLALDGPRDELTELGDTIDDLLGRLDRAFEAQRRFVQNASHELRTPLARQRAIGQVALDDPDASAQALRHAHERILAAGGEQADLIDALLLLARADSRNEIRREAVDLAETTRVALEAAADEAAGRGLVTVADLEPTSISGERMLIERVVTNLVDNAIRYNHAGGTIRLATGVRSGRPVLTVSNTGLRVPRAEVADLLQPFRRLDGARTQQTGHGLGLSIVASVADLHDADLLIDPLPGGGLHIEIVWQST